MKRRGFSLTVAVSMLFLLVGMPLSPPSSANELRSVSILWAQWKPADYLAQLSQSFTQDTGIAVTVHQIPWPALTDLVYNQVWPRRSADYDIIIGDSQWLGTGATQGHYVDLTEWSKANVPWSDVFDNARQFYSEYNGRIYAVPCLGDALGFAYRKDLFESPVEKAAFRTRYGYDLAPPATWDQFRDVAEFFTRPQQGLYGTALLYAGPPAYDDVTMGFDQVLWSFGGELRDAATGAVEGVLNSPAGVQALEFYARELKQFTPPEAVDYGIDQTFQPYTSGRVAMAQNWYSFCPDLLDPAKNPFLNQTGFFMTPAGKGGRFISLGGQGMSISAYSARQDLARQFLAWFSKSETQQQWARLGGLTTHKSVLQSAEFRSARPFNAAYADSVPLMRDFYNNPEYSALLLSTQTHWHAAVTGAETPQVAMDAVAREHTQILRDAGYIQ